MSWEVDGEFLDDKLIRWFDYKTRICLRPTFAIASLLSMFSYTWLTFVGQNHLLPYRKLTFHSFTIFLSAVLNFSPMFHHLYHQYHHFFSFIFMVYAYSYQFLSRWTACSACHIGSACPTIRIASLYNRMSYDTFSIPSQNILFPLKRIPAILPFTSLIPIYILLLSS
jgi:hypothetical protein